MGAHHTSGVDPPMLTPQVHGNVIRNISSYTKLKNMLKECCMDVVGAEDES